MKNLDANDVRRNFADVADQVRVTGEPVLVHRNGRPIVAIVSVQDAERLTSTTSRPLDASFDRTALDEVLKRARALPIPDARPADDILGYGDDGLPS